MSRVNIKAMTIDEYRKIKEGLKSSPINRKTAELYERSTTTLSLVKRSRSFKQYREMRKLNRGSKKTVKEVNAEPVQVPVAKTGRRKKIDVKVEPPILPEGSTVVVPAALFEAMSDQMNELHDALVRNNQLLEAHAAPQFILTADGEPVQAKLPTFKERFYSKAIQIKKRWGVK